MPAENGVCGQTLTSDLGEDYFVGDLQGCLDELQVLLDKVAFDPGKDRLWLTGDLVARGPKSLQTLRFIKSLGQSAKTVLGNHDLHLIATWHGIKKAKPKDLLCDLLSAPDCEELIDWLTHQPMLQVIQDNVIMTHAGLSPQWDIPTAISCAREVENILQSDACYDYLSNMYESKPNYWHSELAGYDRFRYIVNAMTRMRFCYADGGLEFTNKGAPQDCTKADLHPWFELKPLYWQNFRLIFGHWASLMGRTDDLNIIALDTGCVWGNHLTLWQHSKNKYYTAKAFSR
jgi:bis(5'-nucleosyl)-tetraphosphatase (symmetrical)